MATTSNTDSDIVVRNRIKTASSSEAKQTNSYASSKIIQGRNTNVRTNTGDDSDQGWGMRIKEK